MSTTVDERVVEMRFDNRNFENNVSATMSTLDKLKSKLNLSGAAKGLENVDSASRKINFSGLGGAVETVASKFSAMEVVAITTLANITNSAVNAGKRMVSAFTIDPIKTGLQEYETQINAVQTILSNTRSKGSTLEDVNSALDELNTYADKTIYNFTEMTRNIGTFTAAGVDLDTSTNAIKGIANLAAVSGSTSQQASTAMYQLSQALAAGKVQLMDWNSVVNAGMGGQVFQDALKRTAEHMGKDVDGMIKKYGSFRDSLTQGEWLTTEVLTETLTQLSGAYSEADLISQGYTKEQAKEIAALAEDAVNAATKVKTFTQLIDTLKEAVQSGWTQTWEILIGDFEEARSLWTGISDYFGEIIGKSAEARNNVLEGWAKGGGRDMALEGIKNAWEGILSIANPIREAFREIFPSSTSGSIKNLLNLTNGFKELTEKFKIGEENARKLKTTFTGVFSVLAIGLDFFKSIGKGVISLIKNFAGIEDGVLSFTSRLAEGIIKFREYIKEHDILGEAINKVVSLINKCVIGVKTFGSAVKESFETDGFVNFMNVVESVWDFVKSIGSSAGKAFASLGQSISNAIGDFSLVNILNTFLAGGLLVSVKKLKDAFDGLTDGDGIVSMLFGDTIDSAKGMFSGITETLDSVRGCFESYQNNLNADILKKIATSIALIAGSIFLIGTIKPDALNRSLGAMTILFGELMGSLFLFSKLPVKFKGVIKASGLMISMSVSILILSAALKNISSLDTEGIIKGLVAIGVLMAEIAAFLTFGKFDGSLKKSAGGIVLLSVAMLAMSKAVSNFGSLDKDSLIKGISAIGGILAELAIFTRIAGNAKNMLSIGTSMVIIGASMKIFASAVKDFGSMSLETIGKGLLAIGIALAEVTIAMNFMPKNMILLGTGLAIVGGALKIIASALADFGSMSPETIGIGLTALGVALLELAFGLQAMNGSLLGSASLIIAAGALAIIAPVLKSLGGMSVESIAKSLIILAGAFAVIGIAGFVLSPVVPVILALAGAFALFGVSTLAIGAGVALLAAGLTLLSGSVVAAASAIVAAIAIIVVGIADLLPTLIVKFGETVEAICNLLMTQAPMIAETVLVLITKVLESLVTYAPQIIDNLMTFLIGVIDGLAARMPELIVSAVNLIGSFFKGVVDALSGMDVSSLINGIAGIGLLSALMLALGAIASLIPAAMIGVLGMGAVVAELAVVLAAVGAFAQIPGLNWLIGEGGNLLQNIGTAIGKFVGGLAGGIATGVTSSLPELGSNLSGFMSSIEPFIEGAKGLDASSMEGIKALASAILIITAADIVNAITNFLTGGKSMSNFANQLVPLGKGMKKYSEEVAGIDSDAITSSAEAAKGLAKVAKAIPSEGGLLKKFTGEKSMSSFGNKLVPFGKGMKKYAEAVKGIDSSSILSSVEAAKGLAKVGKAIPSEGGWLKKLTGKNDLSSFGKKLVPFGEGMKKYSESVKGISVSAITNSVNAANKLKTFINSLSSFKTTGVSSFKTALNSLGKVSVEGFIKSFSGSTSKLNGAGKNMMDSVVKGVKSRQASLKTAGSSAINALATGMTSKKNSVTKVIDTALTAVVKRVKDKGNAFKTGGESLMTKLASGITSGRRKITSSISTTLSSAVTSIRSKYTSFYNAGAYVVSGFANGISSNTYKAEAKARAMANAAERAAKKALDEHSPSKVFYKIGDYAGLGFVNALGDNVNKAYNASTEMATYAKEGLMNSLSKVKDLIDGNIDSQPTIRPVLDLSNIESGAGAISGLFGSPVSVASVNNAGSISSMMNRRQNGGENEVVSAINKLRKDVSGMSNNSYTINGITYDDGSNVSQAIETLVRAAKIERRI